MAGQSVHGVTSSFDVTDSIKEAFDAFNDGAIPVNPNGLFLGREEGVFFVEYPKDEKGKTFRRNILIVVGPKSKVAK